MVITASQSLAGYEFHSCVSVKNKLVLLNNATAMDINSLHKLKHIQTKVN